MSEKKMRYIFTPEFHRYIWLKFSPFRLLAGPVVPVLWLMLCGNFASGPAREILTVARSPGDFAPASGGLMAFFFIAVAIWGCYEAASALRDEVKGNTWDFLRMSSISPWPLVAGKLFGATSYTWYLGLVTLPFFLYAYVADHGAETLGEALQVAGYMVAAGVIGQATAFLASFIDMVMLAGRTGKNRVPRVIGPFILGLVVSSQLFFGLAVQVGRAMSARPAYFLHHHVTWYGQQTVQQAAMTAGMAFALFWLLFGAYRMARAELMYRVTPVVWMLFLASLLGFLCGFVQPRLFYYYMQLFGLFILSLGITYGVMILEASDGRKYARFSDALRAGDWRRVFENMHKWLAGLPFVLAMYVMTLTHVPEAGLHLSFEALGCFMLALLLFALRDGLVIHMALTGGDGKHVTFKLLFYYVLAYLLLPSVQMAASPGRAVDFMPWFFSLFSYVPGHVEPPPLLRTMTFYYPLPVGSFTAAVLPVLGEALLAAGLLFWRLGRKRAESGPEKS
ncbi:MAG: hypothetical protein GC185_11240 [Alphaproteobacteria bacterium]|nr:hypothetical protein [Alphaproteobacteria bacterium]